MSFDLYAENRGGAVQPESKRRDYSPDGLPRVKVWLEVDHEPGDQVASVWLVVQNQARSERCFYGKLQDTLGVAPLEPFQLDLHSSWGLRWDTPGERGPNASDEAKRLRHREAARLGLLRVSLSDSNRVFVPADYGLSLHSWTRRVWTEAHAPTSRVVLRLRLWDDSPRGCLTRTVVCFTRARQASWGGATAYFVDDDPALWAHWSSGSDGTRFRSW